MNIPSDQQLLLKLQEGDNKAFQFLYNAYFPGITTYILNNTGDKADAEDIFQEALIVLLKKTGEKDFTLTSSLKTYFYSIARNLWLKKLRDRRKISHADYTALAEDKVEDIFLRAEIIPVSSREDKVHQWMEKLPLHCQKILKAIYFYKEPMDNLMVKMGWKNRHSADNQKYKCIRQVKKIAVNDKSV